MSESDYVIDEKMRTANLTEHGIEKIEKILGVKNVYESEYSTLFHIEAALKAKTLFKNNKDYIIRNNEVVIVDEFTGRLLEGRRFSEGIHQAIEAKENVTIQKESKTLATISLQNYFRKYQKLAGMTGTAATEAEELHKIYNLDVVTIPTNRQTIRQDYPDYIYKTERGKFTALVEEIAVEHAKGRPILVGTTSIEKNEILSALLRKKGIKHELLNAKNHEREATIIAAAGQKGAVTIATNMAGRGVDIILGGEAPSKFKILNSKADSNQGESNKSDNEYQTKFKLWKKNHEEVVAVGGLYVIGTERHESRRIDNQLRGRSGRQGDPGQTRFFISLEDEMLRIFGGEQISKLMTFFNFPENQPIEHAMVSKAIEQSQVKVEGFNFDSRKHLLEFDDVLNKQRDIVYFQRNQIIDLMDNPATDFQSFLNNQIEKLGDEVIAPMYTEQKEQREEAIKYLESFFIISPEDKLKLVILSAEEFVAKFKDNLQALFQNKKDRYGEELFRTALKITYLSTIDHYWTEHLTSIEDLREGINLRGYAQLDPLVEYKKESFRVFNNTMQGIRTDFFRRMIHLEINANDQAPISLPHPASPTDNLQLNKENTKLKNQNINSKSQSLDSKHKLGRNDPCWCGSGKKYKRCHYPN
jgi:preprotein translocase subunit SecA